MDSSEDEMGNWNDGSPPIVQVADASTLNILPKKSRDRYEFAYNQFMNWCKEKDVSSTFSEQVMLSYFHEQSKKLSPNSLWTIYSMLRSTLCIHQRINIAHYTKLKAFLKKMSSGYNPKKSKTLTPYEIHKFLNEAPDNKYLLSKVILIIGISGACRKQELSQLKINNIEDLGSAAVINIPDTRTKKQRVFTITGKFYEIFKKYASLRPPVLDQTRFFLNYQQEKCTKQPVGVNKIAMVPKQIAAFLNLKDPNSYTGHCFRRSSATILVDVGGSIKRHGRWRTAPAESYVQVPVQNKMVLVDSIEDSVLIESSSSSNVSEFYPVQKVSAELLTIEEHPSTSIDISPIRLLDPLSIKAEEPEPIEIIPETPMHVMSTPASLSPVPQRNRTFSSSKASLIRNFKYKLSMYKKQIKSLQEKSNRQAKRVANLDVVLKELKTKNFINEEMEEVLKNISGSNQQILRRKLILTKNGYKPKMYSPELRNFARCLHFYSPPAYCYIRKEFNSCLPHSRTISKWYEVTDGKPGFTSESFKAVKAKLEVAPNEILFSLVIDEIALTRRVEYDENQHYGYVDIGLGTKENQSVAKDALVFLLVAVNDNWKIPLGYFLTEGIDGAKRSNLVKQCLTIATAHNIKIVGLIFDDAPANFAMAKILGCQLDPSKIMATWFEYENNKIYIFPDPCRMLKLVRNSFEDLKTILTHDGSTISWKYIENLQKLQEEKELYVKNKIHLQHFHKQKVFSEFVADTLNVCCNELKLKEFADCEATVDFIYKMNILFDICNSRNLQQIGYKKPINLNNFVEIFSFLNEINIFIKGLKTSRQKKAILTTTSRTGFLGILIYIESLTHLFHDVCIGKQLLLYIPTYKFNQDHTEQLFSIIKTNGKNNNNPTAREFILSYKKILLHNNFGHCTPLEEVPALNASSSVIIINQTSGRDRLVDKLNYEEEINFEDGYLQHVDSVCEFSECIIVYMSGFVARMLSQQLSCEECINALYLYDFDIREKKYCLITVNITSKLIYPSEDVVSICVQCEKILRRKLRDNSLFEREDIVPYLSAEILFHFINTNIFSNLKQHCLVHGPLEYHIGHLIKAISICYFKIRLNYITKSKINKSLNFKNIKNKMAIFNRY